LTNRSWGPILGIAAATVDEYPYLITLRQLHYRLVMMPGLEYRNTITDYTQLSARTAAARRAGSFPTLLDQTRQIHRPSCWDDGAHALRSLASQYRCDRTEGQENLVVLGGEKATLLAQLDDWYNELGVPIVLTRGYGSQTYLDDIASMVEADNRPAVLVYAGDLDPSGEDILRDFIERCDVFSKIEHVAVRYGQIAELSLPKMEGNPEDRRAKGFIAKYGELLQVEVEAIEPDTLHQLYDEALDRWFDMPTFESARAREEATRARLQDLADNFPVEDDE
jgi:hypothetical protein